MKACRNGYLAAALLMSASVATAQSGDTSDTGDTGYHHHEVLQATGVPGDSLYQLELPIETAAGVTVPLSSLRGRPLLVTMFYSHCTSVCPLLTAELQQIERGLAPAARSRVRVLMVSFDAVHDTPTVLKSFAQSHHIDDPRWTVARAAPGDVRVLAAALGIRYRELPDHSFNHSAVISLADQEGVVRARAVGLRAVDAQFLDALRSIATAGAASRPGGE